MLRTMGLFAAALWATAWRRLRFGPQRPTWTFGFEWIIEFMRRDWATGRDWPHAEFRRELEKRPTPTTFTRRVKQREEVIGGVACVVVEPTGGATREGVLLYLHGGSYIFCSPKTHADIVARLVVSTGLRAVVPAYRLAPEHPYPAALDDARAVFAALEASGVAARSIVLAGDSAGGNLALVLQLARRDAGKEQAAGALLISPWLDLTESSPSMTRGNPLDYGDRALLLGQGKVFAGSIPLEDPRVSPYFARLEGLAPLKILVGTEEILLDECVEFARRAAAAGVSAGLDRLVEMPHNGPILAEYSQEGRRGVELGAAFLAEVSSVGACAEATQR